MELEYLYIVHIWTWICRDIHDIIVFSPDMNRARWISYSLNKTKTSGRYWQRLKLGLSKSTRTDICLVIGHQTPWTALSWDSFITPPNNNCIFQYSWFIWGGLALPVILCSPHLSWVAAQLSSRVSFLEFMSRQSFRDTEGVHSPWSQASLIGIIDLGSPSVWDEYALLPLFNKESSLAYGRAEYS